MVNKNILFNSTGIYVTAFLMTTILHELSHAIVGFYYNSKPVLHHNFVEHQTSHLLSISHQILIALAGQIMSLLQGFTAGLYLLKTQNRNTFQLLLLWLSILDLFNFIGYLMTGFLFKKGDIGKAFLLVDIPLYL